MSKISSIYQSPHYLKEAHKELTAQQQRAWLQPRKKKIKRPPRGQRPSMTAKQQRVFDLHSRCDPDLRQVGPHMGLFCRQHGTWIKWVTKSDAQKIQEIMGSGK